MNRPRRSKRVAIDSTKDDMLIIIKTPENGGPAEQIADVKTSIIQYMCNKCNKKYTTTVGLKRHLKFCNDSSNDIGLTIPKKDLILSSPKKNITLLENHNDLNSKNLNLLSDSNNISTSSRNSDETEEEELLNNIANLSEDNPYEFEDDNDENIEASEIIDDPNICQCCGEDKSTAHKAGLFKCYVCNKSFKIQSSFDLHNTKYHSKNDDAINCKQCKVICVDEPTMIEHLKKHNEEKCYDCKSCHKKFTRRYNLDRHMKQFGCGGKKQTLHTCQACGSEFSRKDNLLVHLRMHLGENGKKNYKCEYCEKLFKGKSLLTVHLRSHTGETPFSCDQCPNSFKSKPALIKHLRCHTGEKPYSCEECGRKFAAAETLNRHRLIHSESKPCICLLCGKSFIQPSQLRSHMYHHTGVKEFHCDHCSKGFHKRVKLANHIKFVHEGAQKLQCSWENCTKKFMTKEEVNRHMMIHLGNKPFTCETCKKKFTNRSILVVHMRTHRSETPCVCPLCKRRAFIRQDCLLRHLRAKHRVLYLAALKEVKRAKIVEMQTRLFSCSSIVGPTHPPITSEREQVSQDVLNRIKEICAKEVEIDNLKSRLKTRSQTKQAEKSNKKNRLIENQDSLIQSSETSEGIEVEIVDIPLNESYLATSIQELLDLLIDKESFAAFNWSNRSVDEVLEEIIVKCGHTPASPDIKERAERLRENAKLLLTVVIDDNNMKSLFETQTVDEVILSVLRLGKAN